MKDLILSQRLKELRAKHHYTQEYISQQIHIGRATYSNYELGKRMPSLDIIQEFAKFYQVDITYLVPSEDSDLLAATAERVPDALSPNEQQLLLQYRSLSKDQKQFVLDLISFLQTRS